MSKSTRLTTHIKDVLVGRLLAHAFEEREKANKAAFIELGNDVYYDIYPPKLLDKMGALPDGFLPRSPSLKVSFDGVERFTKLSYGEWRRLSHKHSVSAAKVYEENHPFSNRYAALKEEKALIEKERGEAERSARAVMSNVTTLKRLIDVWPEIEPFARDLLVSARSGTLPALPLGDLNKRLGLEK